MKNIGGDEPFGGDIPGAQVFGETDRIMAFDVTLPLDTAVPDVSPTDSGINFGPSRSGYRPGRERWPCSRVRTSLGDCSRCWVPPSRPLIMPAIQSTGRTIQYIPVLASLGRWKAPSPGIARRPRTRLSAPPRNGRSGTPLATPTPCMCIWLISRSIGRKAIKWDSATNAEDRVLSVDPETYDADGTYLVTQTTVQHNSEAGRPSRRTA